MKAYECEVEKIHKSKVEAVKAKLIDDDDVFDLAELSKYSATRPVRRF